MKTKKSALFAAVVSIILNSCSKSDTTAVITPPVPVSNPIAPGDIAGFVKGTLTTGHTYNITGDLTIKAGDSLISQEGVTVVVKNNAQVNVMGVLIIAGTRDKTVSFNSDSNSPGSWGGFQCDSAQAVTIKWAHIDNTGGPDPAGGARKTLYVRVPIDVDIEDSWFTNGQDDLIRMEAGAKITILRNTILSSGSTDGEAINLKTGVTGDVAYNVIYSQAGTAIKLETNALQPFPQTSVNVYNNTLVANGWRRGAAEPGRGVSVGLNAKANIYDNLFVNNYQGLEIFADADTINTKYGYNLFYATADSYTDTTADPAISISLRSNFFPGDGVAKPQSTDLVSTGTTNLDPMFKTFDGTVAAPNGASTSDDFHLQGGSPALGKGNASYSNDIGANTSDATKSNQH
ncbi:MAG: right-handed parallel beta-helix repeat-containing protein [Chitinophagaceae bacterium]|nr:right-handed parallel beta-helix repeat-containing protein [Chitinophagaceae bacterium]